jgi:hypothetical protein
MYFEENRERRERCAPVGFNSVKELNPMILSIVM